MFKRAESAIATLLDDVNEAKRQIGELGYTLSRLEAEVFVLSGKLLRLGEEVWVHGGRSLKDEVNEQHIRIAHLEAVMTRQAKPPPGNTPLAREPAWPAWDSVCQENLGGGRGGVGPYKAPSTDLLPSAAAPKQPPPRKAPPQMSPKWQLVAARDETRAMDHGHGGAEAAPAIPVVASGQLLVAAYPAAAPPPPMTTPNRPVTGEMRPHKAPPLNVRTTPLVPLATPQLQGLAGDGERSLANDRRDPIIMPNLSHAPSRPDGLLDD